MKKKILTVLLLTILFFSITNFLYAAPQPLVDHYQFNLGQFKITALSDGLVAVPLNAYQGNKNYKKIEKKILKQHHIMPTKTKSILVSLNAYIIQFDGRIILVDTGSGGALPPKQDNGFLLRSLKSAGFKPSQITDILFTHLHPDHVGGLITKTGKENYPNAILYINKAGWRFWHSNKEKAKFPKFIQAWFTTARKETAPYNNQIVLFNDRKQKLFPGIYAIPLPGHTPGHTGYLIKANNGKELLIWGDVVHVGMFEFSYPQWSMIFDVSRKQASEEHYQVMNWAAQHHILVAGMHLTFPGVGYVKKEGKEFKFIPLNNFKKT